MPASMDQIKDEWRILRTGAVVQIRPDSGVLRLSDADRVDFLQRMTTNDIAALEAGRATVTILTSPTARNLFAFTVVCRAQDLLLLPSAGETTVLETHLRGQIFFMDKIGLEEVSGRYQRMRLMGPQAGAILAGWGFQLEEVPEGTWQERDGLLAVKQLDFDVPGYELLVASEQQGLHERLLSAGVSPLAHNESYHLRRIELGRPASGYEITSEYTPLEAGMISAVADNKGCYTGQEIIARQITYDKVTKALVGLRLTEAVAPGDVVLADGRSVGTVTSAAPSPNAEIFWALAIVKHPHTAPGAAVAVGGGPGEVVALPFAPEG